jgi:hypothetical protein
MKIQTKYIADSNYDVVPSNRKKSRSIRADDVKLRMIAWQYHVFVKHYIRLMFDMYIDKIPVSYIMSDRYIQNVYKTWGGLFLPRNPFVEDCIDSVVEESRQRIREVGRHGDAWSYLKSVDANMDQIWRLAYNAFKSPILIRAYLAARRDCRYMAYYSIEHTFKGRWTNHEFPTLTM